MWGEIRTFGLDYNDFPTIMNNVALLLRILTIDIYNNSKSISFFFYIMTSIAGITYLYVYTFSMIWMVVCYYGKAGKWTEASVALSLGSCSFTSVTKFVFMKIYANDIRVTLGKFLKCDAQVTPGTRFAKNLNKQLRIVKRRAIIIWLTIAMDGAVYVIIPFLIPGRHFTTDLYIIYGLEPMFESPNFEMATVINIFSIGFGIYTMLSVAVYVIVIVGYIEAQMRALSEELRNVWDDSQNFYKDIKHNIRDKIHAVNIKYKIMNEFIRVRLRDIIKFHITNINLLHELDQEMRPTLAFEFSIMAFSITAELLGGLKHTYLQIPYTVVQVLMNCLVGQRLIDACNDFEDALYSSKWESFNVRNQKTVLLMLRMSQKTLILTAGGVANLDFNCLMMILKSTYSAYTTLESTVK